MAGGQLGQRVTVGLASGQLLAHRVGRGRGQRHVGDVNGGSVFNRGLNLG